MNLRTGTRGMRLRHLQKKPRTLDARASSAQVKRREHDDGRGPSPQSRYHLERINQSCTLTRRYRALASMAASSPSRRGSVSMVDHFVDWNLKSPENPCKSM